MKIAFIFTDEFDLAQVRAGGRFRSNFEVPDAAKALPDIQGQIIAIAESVGELTKASLHVDCADVGLKNYPIKEGVLPTPNNMRLWHHWQVARLYFVRKVGFRRDLTIYAPIQANFPSYPSGYHELRHKHLWKDPTMIAFGEHLQVLSDRLLTLLNTDGDWYFESFHPYLFQNSIALRLRKLSRKDEVEARKQARDEEKRKAREAKLAEKIAAAPPADPLTHGAGRTVGARPGIYKGVQMRSQLEIRFAAELDERGIQWVYEGEALSASSYLVDFYLPDLGVWVEVKGKFEARDRQVLPEVAKYLKSERKHRLLVYTGSGKCFVVNPSGFREVERRNFFGELVR